MYRHWLILPIVATLILPAQSMAQIGRDTPRGFGVRVTPFAGFLLGFTRTEEWLYTGDDMPLHARSDVTIAGGTAAGLQLEVPVYGRLGLMATGAYASRGNGYFGVRQTGEVHGLDGSQALLGRLGVVIHIADEPRDLVVRRMQATLFAGGMALHERPRNRLNTAAALSSGTHTGASLGATLEIPLAAERMAVQFGVDDDIIWWNGTQLSSLPYAYFQPGSPASIRASAGLTHALMLRGGIRVRL